jgi:hypothetical protein
MGINKEKYFNYVKLFFQTNDCELITQFQGFTNKRDNNLTFKCKCGNIQTNINFEWYKRSIYKICKKCVVIKHKRRNKEYANMIDFFNKHGCKLLTPQSSYINNLSKNISYECKCGDLVLNESYQLYYLSTYKCCEKCRQKEVDHRYIPFQKVKQMFKEINVELLTYETDYIGLTNTKFTYKCQCGAVVTNVSYNSLNLSKYRQCKECVKNSVKQTKVRF